MRAAVLALLAACGGSTSDKGGILVELASITLADDCGDFGYMPPPSKPALEPRHEEKAASGDVAASEAYCPPGAKCRSSSPGRSCAQTSMQLAFSAPTVATVKIKKVELLDGMGKYLQDLEPRLPKRWDGSAYVAWNEQLEGGKPLSTSYALTAPNWEKLGGRMEAQTKKYHLHVVVTIGDNEHSLEKQSIQPAVMQPDVVTLR